MRIFFALLASCFLFAPTDNGDATHRHLGGLRFEQSRSCALRTGPADSEDDSLSCQCCGTTQPLGVLAQGVSASDGHLLSDRWTTTATDGPNIARGDSLTLTWGIVRDGTNVVSGGTSEGSSLIATLDDNFSDSNAGTDLTQRRWFPVFDGVFQRYAALSGLNFVYEPNDNGRTLNGAFNPGSRGNVADVRIGGRSIDGQTGSNTLAFNFFPNSGDMVLDTDNTNFFDANDRGFRNVIAHEFGHGLGMAHLLSNSDRFLLEPFISTVFEGPQHADILALHRGYGDSFESGVGNDTVANATFLGDAEGFAVGLDGSLEAVGLNDDDFVSIDGTTDTDVYSFDVTQSGSFAITLAPMGYQYDIAEQAADGNADASTRVTTNTRQLNDLGFTLLGQNGNTVVGVANDSGLGVAESLEVTLAPGTYFIVVTGSVDRAQFYSLTSSTAVPQVDIFVSTTTVAPTTDLLASQSVGGQQYLVDVGRDPGQGQVFSLARDFALEVVTVQIGVDDRGAQDIAEDAAALSLNVYQLPLDPATGNPVPTFDTTTLLGSFNDSNAATFNATTGLNDPLYLTFDLASTGTATLGTLTADTVYAFTITSNSTTDPGFRIERSTSNQFANGNGIFTGGDNNPTLRSNDDAVFFLQGVSMGGVVGDYDGNGVVECADLDGYVGNIGAAADGMLAALDLDGNGTLGASDADAHIRTLVVTSNGIAGTFPGDVNCDGRVDVLGDALALVLSLGGAANMYSQGDINFDGQVNVLGDAVVLVGNLGMSNTP